MPPTDLAGRVVAVTGANGFIGRYVVDALAGLGADVRRLTGPGPAEPDALPVDLTGAAQTRRHLEGAELVIHLAARAGGVQFQEATGTDVLLENNAMTRSVLTSAAAAGVRRVFLASSAVVYAADAGEDLREDANVVAPGREPVSPYAWSKLTDEVVGSWTRDAGLEVVVGRFTNVFGAGATFDDRRSTVVHALVKKAVDAGPGGVLQVWGDGSAVRSFVHVQDAAYGILHVLTDGADGQRYNVSAIGPVSIREIAEVVRDTVDESLTMAFDEGAPTGVPRRVLDASKLRGLGFDARIDLATGIRDVVAAYRAEA